MSKILLLDKILDSLKKWITNHHEITTDIQNNILQKDSADKFEEKLISIGFSSVLVYIGTAVLGVFGVATGGIVVAIILFPIGWVISKLINKKIFGNERKIEDISQEEQSLLKSLQNLDDMYKSMRLQVRFKKIAVNFTNFKQHKSQLDTIAHDLALYDTSNLALKYRVKQTLIAKKYSRLTDDFTTIYAHKKGKRYA